MKKLKKIFLKQKPTGEPINLDPNFKPGVKIVASKERISFNEWGSRLDPNILYPGEEVTLKKAFG